jgi:hypothetical protein
MMAMTTNNSIKVNARRGFIPDKTPLWEIRVNLFLASLYNVHRLLRQAIVWFVFLTWITFIPKRFSKFAKPKTDQTKT